MPNRRLFRSRWQSGKVLQWRRPTRLLAALATNHPHICQLSGQNTKWYEELQNRLNFFHFIARKHWSLSNYIAWLWCFIKTMHGWSCFTVFIRWHFYPVRPHQTKKDVTLIATMRCRLPCALVVVVLKWMTPTRHVTPTRHEKVCHILSPTAANGKPLTKALQWWVASKYVCMLPSLIATMLYGQYIQIARKQWQESSWI